jgi:hypothetical protein
MIIHVLEEYDSVMTGERTVVRRSVNTQAQTLGIHIMCTDVLICVLLKTMIFWVCECVFVCARACACFSGSLCVCSCHRYSKVCRF